MTTRREFLSLPLAGQGPAPLNLLLITCDQHRADCLGCYGNPVIRTPVADRLAAEGTRFSSYYVQVPQCVPSRASLHTGRYPHVHRTPTNTYVLPETEQTLARVLGCSGYRTAVVGELPFAPQRYLGGFEESVASFREYDAFLGKHGLEPQKDFGPYQSAPAPWNDALDETAFFAEQARGYLQRHRAEPFFLHVSFRRPHHPFNPPAPFDRMYVGAGFPKSHRRDGEMDNKPPQQQQALRSSVGFDLTRMTPQDLDVVKARYYGMISENDKYIGAILDELKSLGLDGRTVVVLTSDHGEMLGDHGLLFKGGYMYDELLHVPLILRAPGRLPAGRTIDALVEEVDLYPALLELLGIAAPPGVQGRSLLTGRKDAVFAEFPTIKCARTRDWKLVHYPRQKYGELYDLRNDPHELYNLWGDAQYAPRRADMLALLADFFISTQDSAFHAAPLAASSVD